LKPRFYLPGGWRTDEVVSLRGEELHHLRNVLRLVPGDGVAIFDGKGRGFCGEILEVKKDEARIRIKTEESGAKESFLSLTLIVALTKGEKLDLVVQKVTELGVTAIQPVSSVHGDVRMVPGREEKRLERWRRIALEACKQSGRNRLPCLSPPEDLRTLLSHRGADLGIFLDTEVRPGEKGALERIPGVTSVHLAAGPEGGWSREERVAFRDAGFLPLRLGSRVLRSETAAIAATALLQFLTGDLDERREEKKVEMKPDE